MNDRTLLDRAAQLAAHRPLDPDWADAALAEILAAVPPVELPLRRHRATTIAVASTMTVVAGASVAAAADLNPVEAVRTTLLGSPRSSTPPGASPAISTIHSS